MRRKTNKKRKPLTRSLLLLFKKINKELDCFEKQFDFEMSSKYHKRRVIIKKIGNQQELLFKDVVKPKNRIVSIDKEYLRPIVRN